MSHSNLLDFEHSLEACILFCSMGRVVNNRQKSNRSNGPSHFIIQSIYKKWPPFGHRHHFPKCLRTNLWPIDDSTWLHALKDVLPCWWCSSPYLCWLDGNRTLEQHLCFNSTSLSSWSMRLLGVYSWICADKTSSLLSILLACNLFKCPWDFNPKTCLGFSLNHSDGLTTHLSISICVANKYVLWFLLAIPLFMGTWIQKMPFGLNHCDFLCAYSWPYGCQQ